jgi:hypothetical protein
VSRTSQDDPLSEDHVLSLVFMSVVVVACYFAFETTHARSQASSHGGGLAEDDGGSSEGAAGKED